MDEFNGKTEESKRSAERSPASETVIATESEPCAESIRVSETPDPSQGNSKKPKKRGGRTFRLVMSAAAAVTVVAAVAVVAPETVAPSSRSAAEITEIWATDTTLDYRIDVRPSGDEPFTVLIYNSMMKRSEEFPADYLVEGVIGGYAENLKPETVYNISVVVNYGFGNVTLAKKTVKTLAESEMTKLTDVRIDSGVRDGTFFFGFEMDYQNPRGYWTGFEAWLTDGYDRQYYCEWTDDLSAQQTIDVREIAPWSCVFYLTAISTDPYVTDGEPVEIYLWTEEIDFQTA